MFCNRCQWDEGWPFLMAGNEILIRRAEPEDALAVARVHIRSWQVAYRGLIADEYLDGLRAEERAAQYDFSNSDPLEPYTDVVVEGGTIVGFASTTRSRDLDTSDEGELAALYVDPEYWGRGIGVELISAGREHLLGLGFRSAILWVLAGNVRADRFYRLDGWVPDGVVRSQSIWGLTLDEVRYRRGLSD